ncbi:L-allo-threonine aldolase [Blastomyces dermatitidis ATCC 18188]|uniref:L-allo-threonine aldolase n=1 Tax=Ajellomyces dermatitidis (strain ATCC 18188 / CBS 674.68) TaxID=653446 RepID=F2TH24_AJEDA|nr:L-allo-threonine aldolase [Blastomyces dermatitidis ATCC 18188]
MYRLFSCQSQQLSAPLGRIAWPQHNRKTITTQLGRPALRAASTMPPQTIIAEAARNARAATHDFRSDTATLPTSSMLSSTITEAPRYGDDVFSQDEPTSALETYVGELTGLGNALFVSSGTMGNQLALRALLHQPPHSVVCGRQSHVFVHECGMASMFSQAHLIPVLNSPHMSDSNTNNEQEKSYMTLESIIPNIVPADGEIHGSPTRIIALENTHNGQITPVSEVKRIGEYARQCGLKVHMDGARLWNACYPPSSAGMAPAQAAETAKSLLREYCSHVDTVSLCFSKSLGAPAGSILAARSPEVIARARHLRKALGGGMRQTGILTAPARVAIDEVFLAGEPLLRANAVARELEEEWVALGGAVMTGLAQETNMVWLDLGRAGVAGEELEKIAEEEGVRVYAPRIVTHYQISADGLAAMKRVLKRTMELSKKKKKSEGAELPMTEHQVYSYKTKKS